MKLNTIWAAAVVAALPLAMPAHAETLKGQVKDALAARGVDNRDNTIKVKTHADHSVALSGTVATRDDVHAAIAAAKAVPGVTDVSGSFDVKSSVPPTTPIR